MDVSGETGMDGRRPRGLCGGDEIYVNQPKVVWTHADVEPIDEAGACRVRNSLRHIAVPLMRYYRDRTTHAVEC